MNEPAALAWFEKGVDFENERQLGAAQIAYEQALRFQPDFAEAHFNLGNVLRALGNWQGAAWRYREALAIEPALACAWFNLADLHESRREPQEAVHCLHQAVAVDPGYADAHYNLALWYEDSCEFEKAMRHWRTYLQLDRSSDWSHQARKSMQRCCATLGA